jgi:hypothetical protein
MTLFKAVYLRHRSMQNYEISFNSYLDATLTTGENIFMMLARVLDKQRIFFSGNETVQREIFRKSLVAPTFAPSILRYKRRIQTSINSILHHVQLHLHAFAFKSCGQFLRTI